MEVKETIQVETSKKIPKQTADVITISSDSESPAIVEEMPETSTKVLASDETDGITETVEVESSSLATKDHPDNEIMETVEELGLYVLLLHQFVNCFVCREVVL